MPLAIFSKWLEILHLSPVNINFAILLSMMFVLKNHVRKSKNFMALILWDKCYSNKLLKI